MSCLTCKGQAIGQIMEGILKLFTYKGNVLNPIDDNIKLE